ncbi:MAG: hypothetical protein WC967_01130 [Balneolaceae bacterium]
MKSLKLTISALALVAMLSVNAFAQTFDSDNVSAKAVIVGSIAVTNVADLDFGSIITAATPTIAATDAEAGAVKVAGATTGTTMNVSIVYPATLTDGTPANDLTFATYTAAVTASGDDATPGNGVALTGASTVGQTITGTYTSGADEAHIFVGGQISDASKGVAGNSYANDIVVTVDYN